MKSSQFNAEKCPNFGILSTGLILTAAMESDSFAQNRQQHQNGRRCPIPKECNRRSIESVSLRQSIPQDPGYKIVCTTRVGQGFADPETVETAPLDPRDSCK